MEMHGLMQTWAGKAVLMCYALNEDSNIFEKTCSRDDLNGFLMIRSSVVKQTGCS